MILIFFGTTENPQTDLTGAQQSHCIYAKGEGLTDKPRPPVHTSGFLIWLEKHPYPLLSYLSRSSLSSISFFSQQIPGEMAFQPAISAKCLLDPNSKAHWMVRLTQSRLLLKLTKAGKKNSSQIFQVRSKMTAPSQDIAMTKHSNHSTKG